jgi:hypothetical protein
VSDKGTGARRELVEQSEPELIEAWQRLEEAHTGLWGMQGFAGPDAKQMVVKHEGVDIFAD